MPRSLLLNFRKEQSQTGTDRDTLKQIAEKLGCSETMAAHMAINRLYRDLFTGNVAFDLPNDAELKQADRAHEVQGGQIVDDIAHKP